MQRIALGRADLIMRAIAAEDAARAVAVVDMGADRLDLKPSRA